MKKLKKTTTNLTIALILWTTAPVVPNPPAFKEPPKDPKPVRREPVRHHNLNPKPNLEYRDLWQINRRYERYHRREYRLRRLGPCRRGR